MNMMKTLVPVLKTEYGTSDGNPERTRSPSSVGDANLADDGVSVNFPRAYSTLVDSSLSFYAVLPFVCII
jgi:hypothetical protein